MPFSSAPDAPVLTIQEGYGQSRDVLIDNPPLVIGRGEDCGLRLDDRNVSRHHAEIAWNSDWDSYTVRDLGSANGTFVNSTPVTHQPIKHLDVLQIGGVMMVFNDPNRTHSRPGTAEEDDSGKIDFNFDFLKDVIGKLERNISIVFKGKPEAVRNTLVALFADGHLLLEDAPGVGKSILAQTLAKSIQAQYRRIQFTPDMLPSDITGMNIFDESAQAFKFVPGPIFGNVILADEINRTSPRTQSSLLECMSESVVTIDGKGHVLPKPFFVIATENPEDYHGTYPLPEPQLDRFLMCLRIGYPSPEAEKEILDSQAVRHPLGTISYVIKGIDVAHCQALVRKVHVSDAVKNYIVRLSNRTREHPALCCGCSPRASLALMRASQSLAAYRGRDFVTPKDVQELIVPVWAHRLRLKLRHQAEWKNAPNVLDSIVQSVAVDDGEKK